MSAFEFGLLGVYRHPETDRIFYCDQTIIKRGRLVCFLTDRRGTEYQRWDFDITGFTKIG